MSKVKPSHKKRSANYGIIGPVNAKAVAVGARSSASVTEGSYNSGMPQDADVTLARLEAQIERLKLPSDSAKMVKGDIDRLRAAAHRKPMRHSSGSKILAGLISKLRAAGVLLNAATALHDPLVRIASWFGVQQPF